MFASPFAFVVFDGDLNAPQDFLADGADCRAKGVDKRFGVEVKDILEVNMLKTLPRLHSAPCHEGVGYAGGRRATERCSDVEIIIFFEEGTVNDVENVLIALIPKEIDEFRRDVLQLIFQAVPRKNTILVFQLDAYRSFMLRTEQPYIRAAFAACIGNIEDESEPGIVAGVVYERDALGAAANISSHAVIPQGILRARRRPWALGVDLDLLMERVLIQSGGCVQKSRPLFQTACDLPCGLCRQLGVLLNFVVWHLASPPDSDNMYTAYVHY